MVFGCFACVAEELRCRLLQARLRHVFCLCTGALFFFLGGSKGAVLAPPQVLFFAVPELGFRWCLAVSHALPRSCVFGFSRLGCAIFFVYVLGLFSSSEGVPKVPFWPRRRSCFLLCRSSVLGGVWLFRMRCRGAAFSASPGSAAPCFLSMYWGSFLLLRGFQRCRSGPAAGLVFCCAGARF